MPKTISLFSYFPNLSQVSAERVVSWLSGSDFYKKQNPTVLENEIGNRILYPEVIPTTQAELALDFAILREAIKLHPDGYLNENLKKLSIPGEFLSRFPDLLNLTWAFIDALAPEGVVSIYLKSAVGPKSLGTYMKAKIVTPEAGVSVWLNGQRTNLGSKRRVVIPAPGSKFVFKFESEGVELLGQNQITFEAAGGPLGALIDLL